MSTHDLAGVTTCAETAAVTAVKLMPGTWDAVQALTLAQAQAQALALALASIAHSLAALAGSRDGS